MVDSLDLPIADLLGLATDASREAFVDRHARLIDPAVVVRLAEEVRRHVRVDTQQALRLAEAGIAIARRTEDRTARALAARAKANALYMLGQNQAAVNLHDSAIALLEEAGNREELGRSLSASLQPLALLGLYDRAFDHARRAREIFSGQGDALRLARLEINFANILHRQDRFVEALAAYRSALNTLWPDKDTEGIAVVLHNIAVCLIALDDFREAMATYGKARDFCQAHQMPLLVLQADYNIASLYYQRGEYGRAIASLNQTRRLCEANGDTQHQALCLLDLAGIYLELNLPADAERAAEEGFQHFERLEMGYEAAKCLVERAIALGRKGKHPAALQLFEEARLRFAREQNRAWHFLIDLYQALLHADCRRWDEARLLASSALPFFLDASLLGKAVVCQLLLARAALETGDRQGAETACRHALEIAIQLDSPSLLYQSHALLGRILEASGRAAEAWEVYEAACRETELLRASLAAEEQKIAFLANKTEVCERLVALAAGGLAGSFSSPAEGAFHFMEQARCRTLLDLLHGPKTGPSDAPTGSEYGESLGELRRELHWYRSRLEQEEFGNAPAAPERLAELRRQARQRERELLRLLREDPSREPSLAASRVASLSETQAALPAHSVLIAYFRTGSHWTAAAVTANSVVTVPVGDAAAVTHALRCVRFQFDRLRLSAPDAAAEATSLAVAQTHLATLHDELIEPLRAHLQGARHLILVPHDLLNAVPFHALYNAGRYLLDDYAVSYVPSASLLAFGAQRPRPPRTRSLVLGVADGRAPRIDEEVEAVASLLGDAEVHLGPHATAAVLRGRGPGCRYIHIASHGHFRPDNPMFSGVRLGDGDLDVHDLYRLNVDAGLVTLSGCGTALHVLAKGDERLGIERALLLAGARSVLLSMWDVHDACSAVLLPEFYRGLAAGLDKAEALRRAQILIRGQFPHPACWGSFALTGDASAEPSPENPRQGISNRLLAGLSRQDDTHG